MSKGMSRFLTVFTLMSRIPVRVAFQTDWSRSDFWILLARGQLHEVARRMDAVLLDDGRGQRVARVVGEELPRRLQDGQRRALGARADLGHEDVGHAQRLGHLAGLVQAARVAAATGVLVVLEHGLQPVGVVHAGGAQPVHRGLRVGADRSGTG